VTRSAALPVAGQAFKGSSVRDAADAAPLPKWIRILLVENEADDAELIAREVAQGGFQPFMTRVETAEAARAFLESEEWDLVISDQGLPGSSGQEVLATLQETGLDIPFILVSGSVGDAAAVAAMRSGATDYVFKDNLARLSPVIERELAASRSRAAHAAAERASAEATARELVETTWRARRFEVLHELAIAASGVLDETTLGSLTVDRAAELLDADSSVLRWFDAASGLLVRTASNDPHSHQRTLRLPPSDSVMGRAFSLDAPVSLSLDQLDEDRVPGRADGVAAMAAVPVRSAGRAVGALAVMRYADRPFQADDVELLTLLAGLVGPAIEAARLHGRLASSEERIRGIYDALSCGVVVESTAGEVIELNRKARTLFGEEASAELLSTGGMRATYFDAAGNELDPTQRPWTVARDGRHEPQNLGINIEGRPPLCVITESIRSVDSTGAGLVVTSFIDVTELKRAETALSNSEALFKTAFEGAPGGASVLSPEGAFLRTNQALSHILGYSADELRELKVRDVVHPHDWQLRDEIDQVLEGDDPVARSSLPTVLRNIRKDGVTIWVSLKVAATRDDSGRIRNYVTQVADVTEQRAADERQEQTRHLLDQAQEIGSLGTWIAWLKPGEERLVCSNGLLKILGLPATFSGSLASLGGFIHPDDLESARRAFNATLAEGGSDLSLRVIRPNGDLRWIHQRTALVRDQRGVPAHVLGVTQDVTDEYLAELSARQDRQRLSEVLDNSPMVLFAIDREGRPTLAEGNALTTFGVTSEQARSVNVFELFAAVPEALHHIRAGLAGESFVGELEIPGPGLWFDLRYEPLYGDNREVIGLSGIATNITDRVQAQRTRDESEAKARLAAMMNHEVRTPLNSVLGFAELLEGERVGPLNPTQTRYVANIRTAGRHLLSLVNESLDLAKLAAGKMGFDLQVIQVALVLQEVVVQVEPMLDSRELKMRLAASPGLTVRADQRHLVQVLFNLLSNAIKHSPIGGTITLDATRAGENVLISVKDEGKGIPAGDVDRIFVEFVTLNSGVEGTGLGLALSRKLAELMDGDLSVTSEVGVGSIFTLTLPAFDAAASHAEGDAG
jgi:PAS domain S-box-containing protein